MDNELDLAISECRFALYKLKRLLESRGILPSLESKLKDLPPIISADIAPPKNADEIRRLMDEASESSALYRQAMEQWAAEHQKSIVAREVYIVTSALDRLTMLAEAAGGKSETE